MRIFRTVLSIIVVFTIIGALAGLMFHMPATGAAIGAGVGMSFLAGSFVVMFIVFEGLRRLFRR